MKIWLYWPAEQRREGEAARRPLAAPEVSDRARSTAPRGSSGPACAGAPERQDVDEHPFVEADPIGRDQAALGMPAHRDRRAAVGAEEIPVGARVDASAPARRISRSAGIVAVVILAGEQDAHQQDRRVDARQLDVPMPEARLHVEEVVEEALVAGGARRLAVPAARSRRSAASSASGRALPPACTSRARRRSRRREARSRPRRCCRRTASASGPEPARSSGSPSPRRSGRSAARCLRRRRAGCGRSRAIHDRRARRQRASGQ